MDSASGFRKNRPAIMHFVSRYFQATPKRESPKSKKGAMRCYLGFLKHARFDTFRLLSAFACQ